MPQVAVTLDPAMLADVTRRAAALGQKPGDYVRRLAETAWHARSRQEKNLPARDVELDEAIRAIFALSGEFSTAAISRATGFPESLVRDVLKGLRTVAGEYPASRAVSPPSAAGPAAARRTTGGGQSPAALRQAQGEGEPPEGGAAADAGGYPVELIRELWAEGLPGSAIAKRIGKTTGAFSVWAGKHRDVCPRRMAPKGGEA